jgi:hypothetical protein
LMPLTGSKNCFFAPNGSRMERVNGNLADFIPRFGLEVVYTHPISRCSTLGLKKKAVSPSANVTIRFYDRGLYIWPGKGAPGSWPHLVFVWAVELGALPWCLGHDFLGGGGSGCWAAVCGSALFLGTALRGAATRMPPAAICSAWRPGFSAPGLRPRRSDYLS